MFTRISEQITIAQIQRAALEMLRRLQAEFSNELATLRGRVDALEARTTTIEKQQFSTTTKLQGIIVMAANTGDLQVSGSLTFAVIQSPILNPTQQYSTELA